MARTGEPPLLGRFQEIGGRRLWLHSAGKGGPTIVFLPGAGAVGLDYFAAFERAAPLGASLLYDRAGTGWSLGAPLARTAADVTDELRTLLKTVGAPAPYLLVGHSLGGLFARHYAQRFPGEVAALLLLDPAHEDYAAHMPAAPDAGGKPAKPSAFSAKASRVAVSALAAAARNPTLAGLIARVPAVARYQALYRGLFNREMAGWPDAVREALAERHVSLPWLMLGMQEAFNAEQFYAETRAAGPMPDAPLIILCSSAIDDFRRAMAPDEAQVLIQGRLDGQRRLYETLAASVPRGEVRLVDAGHVTLPYRHPEAILSAIRDLLAR